MGLRFRRKREEGRWRSRKGRLVGLRLMGLYGFFVKLDVYAVFLFGCLGDSEAWLVVGIG